MLFDDFPVTLRAILEKKYFPVNLRVQSDLTKKQYHFALDNLETFLTREATISDLSDDNVAGMMKMLLSRGRAATTINDRRIRINALWNWLCKKGHLLVWPTNYALDEPEPDPQAWSRNDMKKIVGASDCFIEGDDRKNFADWWHALFHVVWDSGARTGEILKMRWEWLDWTTGNIRVPAKDRKGKRKCATYRLKPPTLEKLRLLGAKDSGVIFGTGCAATFYHRYRKLLERAGIPRTRRNGLQRWRRSFATYIELAGGDATRELLHDDRSTTKRAYLDASMLNKPQNVLLFKLGSVEGDE